MTGVAPNGMLARHVLLAFTCCLLASLVSPWLPVAAQSPGAPPASSAAAASQPAASPAGAQASTEPAGPTAAVTVAVEVWPTSFDPGQVQPGPATIVCALHQPLFSLKPDSTDWDPETSLAANVNVSTDGRVWELKIKLNQMFSDKTPIKPEDVAFSLGRLLLGSHPARPANPAIPASLEGLVTQIAAKGNDTVSIELKEPYGPMIAFLASPAASIISSRSFAGGKMARMPVGCGPYIVAHEGPGHQLELRPNLDFTRRRPRLNVHAVQAPPGSAAVLWLLAGRGDVAEGLTQRAIDDAAAQPRLKVHDKKAGLAQVTLYINPSATPFQSVPVREAVVRGIPDDVLTRFLYGGRCVPTRGFYPPWSWGSRGQYKSIAYDVIEARRMLQMANIDRAGTAFVLWVVPPADMPASTVTPFLEALRTALRELNVHCLTDVVPAAELDARLAAGAPQAVMVWTQARLADPDEVATLLLERSPGLARMAGVSGEDVIGLLRQARAKDNYPAREFMYGELETRLERDMTVITLASPARAAARTQRIGDLRFGPDGVLSLEELRLAQ